MTVKDLIKFELKIASLVTGEVYEYTDSNIDYGFWLVRDIPSKEIASCIYHNSDLFNSKIWKKGMPTNDIVKEN